MTSSLKVKITKKFFVFYLITVLFATLSFISGLYFYYNYLTQTILKTTHNALFVSDFHSLKETIAPLVDQNIQSIQILNSKSEIVFSHQAEAKALLTWTLNQFSADSKYEMFISFNVTLPVCILFLIYVCALIIIYPISYIEKQNYDRKRKEFILSLSQKYAHDIRSPLSSLNLIASKMKDSEIQKIQQGISQSILESSDLFLKKIKNFAENPDLQNNFIEEDSHSARFSEIIAILKNEFENKSLTQEIQFHLLTKQNRSLKNKNILLPIIRNIIQNAIEATDPLSGKIEVTIQSSKESTNKIEIVISDNGVGIPQSILKKVGKEKLSYGKETLNDSGYGIALYNAEKDLKALGHQLLIESEETKGSRFIIKLSMR